MGSSRTPAVWLLVAISLLMSSLSQAQTLVDIQTQLQSLYPLSKATADGTDLVTPGALLVLQKDGLVMNQAQLVPIENVYKHGAIKRSVLGGFLNLHFLPADSTSRTFVSGEKVWVTAIVARPDGFYFKLMSDPINNERYTATLKFPFARGSTPAPDAVLSRVAEVFKVDQDSGNQGNGDQAQDSGAAPQAPVQQTKKISLGESRDEVIATFGVPSKEVKLRSKEIDFFPGMKVTFINDKVTDVE